MTPEQIIVEVANFSGLALRELIGAGRKKQQVDARCLAFGILRQEGLTLKRIGGIFNNRHHSTVISGLSTFDSLLLTDKQFKNQYKKLKKHLYDKAT